VVRCGPLQSVVVNSHTRFFFGVACTHGADVVFLLDASGSIGRRNFEKATRLVGELVEMLDVDGPPDSRLVSRVGLVTFGDNATVQFHLDRFSNRDDILHATNVRHKGGTTNTHLAIR